jgi:hypothetical protein
VPIIPLIYFVFSSAETYQINETSVLMGGWGGGTKQKEKYYLHSINACTARINILKIHCIRLVVKVAVNQFLLHYTLISFRGDLKQMAEFH